MAEGRVKSRVDMVLEKVQDCFWELQEIMGDASDVVSTVQEMLRALETGNHEGRKMGNHNKTESRICTHTCVHHPEVVNPGLWSKLPDHLVGLVFAQLPIPRIIELRKSSAALAAVSDSASFKGAFAEAHPKLFGLLGWDCDVESFRTRYMDEAYSTEWHAIDLDFLKANGFNASFLDGSWKYDVVCDSDGGLVCFSKIRYPHSTIPQSIFVSNPLTNAWRKLPNLWESFTCVPHYFHTLQLVANELSYRVILVYTTGDDDKTFGAFVYDSIAGSWSVMCSGLVYLPGYLTLLGRKYGGNSLEKKILDCATNRVIHLSNCAAIQDLEGLTYSFKKDLLFVLHALTCPDLQGDNTEKFVISEFMWESSKPDLTKLNDYEVPSMGLEGRDDVEIFTSTGFILSTWDNRPELAGSVRQLMRMYDVAAGRWSDLPPLIGHFGTMQHPERFMVKKTLDDMFMCELRWDANP